MANIKITDLTAYTDPLNTDVLPIVDVTSDTTKKVSIADLLKNASAGTAAAPGIAFDGDNTGIYSPGADQLAISTGGTGRLFVNASGNVGVGTASPSELLHLNATEPKARFQSSTSSALISLIGDDLYLSNDYTSLGASPSIQFWNAGTEKARITSTGTLMHLGAGNSTTPAVQFNGSAPANSMVMLSDGKVGLGTSSPSEKLELGSGNIKLANVGRIFSVDGTRGSIQISAPNDGTSRRVTYGNNYYLDSDSTYKQGSAAIGGCALELTAPNAGYGTLKFIQKQDPDSGGATRDALVIYENGNVGIGSSSPQSELTVRGSTPQITLEPTADTQNCRIQFALTDGTVQSQITGGGSQGSEIRFSQGPTERLRITSTGTLMHLGAGNSTTPAVQFNGSAPVNSLIIDSSGRLLVGTSSTTKTLRQVIQGNSADSTGNAVLALAIGRTNPETGALGQLQFTNSSHNIGARIIAEGAANWVDGSSHPTSLVFSTTADGASSPTQRMRISANGRFNCQGIYSFTTASAANVFVASDGNVVRSTSSSKYKTQVEAADYHYSEALLGCEPVWYRSTCAGDNPEWGWWGFIAEDVAKIDPRLVHWKTVQVTDDENGAAVQSPCDPEPEGVAYDRFVPHLLNLIKRQKEQIETMEARLSALEAS